MKKYLLLCGIAFFSVAAFGDTEIAEEVEQAVNDNLEYILKEDLELSMTTVHPDSPNYPSTRDLLQRLFEAYDLKYEILEFHFIGVDDEYAYARVLQKSEKVTGPQFRNNELNALQVFKKDNGVWKLWSQANLSIDYLDD